GRRGEACTGEAHHREVRHREARYRASMSDAATNERTLQFPEGFVWGTATSSHQIEGGDVNNDWWDWEHNPDSGCLTSSGDACDSFHRWPEDVNLVADLGL